MLDKGKGPIVRKLRIIQLIEADLQLLMWIFLGSRNVGVIEVDNILSKHNYRESPLIDQSAKYNNLGNWIFSSANQRKKLYWIPSLQLELRKLSCLRSRARDIY